nr:immunoglobulin heavy chain junction region [Macaca mulatta]MOY17933.1 immunoglobulin heavy chain junction region [Macaca mulatta]MOY18155.1 immunoglobulin heavy chain junction region [Macaca mulatta]MOY18214.1 immunoglobulin heavy chain junction region [Macaca mulatta]MOY18614.1 immunoglobulin heavy chain junction region [Macaca mulatta]
CVRDAYGGGLDYW